MKRGFAFHPSVTTLESRWLPAVAAYPDIFRNALQASYVAQADSKANDLVFLGDSITQFWGTTANPSTGTAAWSADFAKLGAANFGIAGDTTQNLLYRIEDGDLNGQPKVVVLMIGVNDLLGGASAEQDASNITSVVQAIHSASPSSKVLLLGVLPTEITSVNANIPEVNALISGLGAEPYVTFLNPGLQFDQPDGTARPSLLKDIVHPNAAGYQLLANAIDGTVLGLLGDGTPEPAPAPTSTPSIATTAPATKAVTQAVATPTSPDFALIPLVVGVNAQAEATVAPPEASSRARSFATELIDVSPD